MILPGNMSKNPVQRWKVCRNFTLEHMDSWYNKSNFTIVFTSHLDSILRMLLRILKRQSELQEEVA